MDAKRPVIKIPITSFGKILDASSLLLLIILWVYTFYLYTHSPQIIPTHFDTDGKINDYGDKNTLWLLPLINTALFITFSVLVRYPHNFNYPMYLNETNAKKQYSLAVQLIRSLKFSITCIFLIIAFTISIALSNRHFPFQALLLPVILCFVFVPVAIYFYKALKK